MEIQADLSVCTFTQKPGPTLHRLLTSIYQAADPVSVEVIVVDQSKGKESAFFNDFPDVIVYQSHKIEPFAQAHNRAMSLTTGRYIALIEEDVVLTPNYFTETLTFLDDNPDVGIVGPKIYSAYGKKEPSCRTFCSPLSIFASYTPFGQLTIGRRLIAQHIRESITTDRSSEIDWICGGSHIIRRELFEEIGPFDEKLSLPFTEQDYYLRAKQKGWHNVYFPAGEVIHARPERYHLDLQISSSSLEIFRNMARYFRKKWFHSPGNPG